MKYLSKSEQETQAVARAMARHLRAGDLLCLRGDLGAGKSVFARALIRALVDDAALEVPSPTFTLLQTYDTAHAPLSHFDLYRLKTPEDIHELGWDDALYDGITLVEWPERLGALIPPNRLDIAFAPLAEAANHREITLVLHGAMKDRHEFYA